MCDLSEITVCGRCIRVADIKKEYIENIIKSIPLCKAIDKVILFGSALERRCKDSSDVDIAIFGKYPKSKMFKLKSYNDFVEAIVSYGGLQDYDLLYYTMDELSMEEGFPAKKGQYTEERKALEDRQISGIMQDIRKGEVIYERM